MRSEQQYLLDIVEAADAIGRFLVGIDRETFRNDELRQSAIMQKIGVVGEAAGKISPTLACLRRLIFSPRRRASLSSPRIYSPNR